MESYSRMQEESDDPNPPPSYNESINPTLTATPQSVGLTPKPSLREVQQIEPEIIFIQATEIPPLGPEPCMVTCPSCHHRQSTKIQYETTSRTHHFALLLCAFGLICFVCLPYFMNTCKNHLHYCANCGAYLGAYDK